MYLKQNNNLAFFVTHGHNHSIEHKGICETCFRPLTEDCQRKRDGGEENTKENPKSVKIIINEFCDETSAHGFARCRKEHSHLKRGVWCFITGGVFVGIVIHLLFLTRNFLR